MEHSLAELRITVAELEKRMDGLSNDSKLWVLFVKLIHKLLDVNLNVKQNNNNC